MRSVVGSEPAGSASCCAIAKALWLWCRDGLGGGGERRTGSRASRRSGARAVVRSSAGEVDRAVGAAG